MDKDFGCLVAPFAAICNSFGTHFAHEVYGEPRGEKCVEVSALGPRTGCDIVRIAHFFCLVFCAGPLCCACGCLYACLLQHGIRIL